MSRFTVPEARNRSAVPDPRGSWNHSTSIPPLTSGNDGSRRPGTAPEPPELHGSRRPQPEGRRAGTAVLRPGTGTPKFRLLDAFCGEQGAGWGYHLAGFQVEGVDNSPARLARARFRTYEEDAIDFILNHGHEYDVIHASPPCTGYTRGTAAIPDRLARYERLIAVTRMALETVGKPYVIENVADARRELLDPVLLCGRMFGLATTDEDGTPLVLDRHRLFESTIPLRTPLHHKHDRSLQVAGSYGGARRDKTEARLIRKGGYVPSADVQRRLLGTPWMTEKGCQLSIPPAYTEYLGRQLIAHLRRGHP